MGDTNISAEWKQWSITAMRSRRRMGPRSGLRPLNPWHFEHLRDGLCSLSSTDCRICQGIHAEIIMDLLDLKIQRSIHSKRKSWLFRKLGIYHFQDVAGWGEIMRLKYNLSAQGLPVPHYLNRSTVPEILLGAAEESVREETELHSKRRKEIYTREPLDLEQVAVSLRAARRFTILRDGGSPEALVGLDI